MDALPVNPQIDIQFLVDGEQYFPKVAEALLQAKEEVSEGEGGGGFCFFGFFLFFVLFICLFVCLFIYLFIYLFRFLLEDGV